MTDDPRDIKRFWLSVARAGFRPGPRQPCHVCGRFSYVTEAHHIVPLGRQFDRHQGLEQADHEHVWLCPNHHVALHVLINGDLWAMELGPRTAPIFKDHSREEIERLMELVHRSAGHQP